MRGDCLLDEFRDLFEYANWPVPQIASVWDGFVRLVVVVVGSETSVD